MKKLLLATATVLAFTPAFADDDEIRANLMGFQEVPVVSTVGTGRLKAQISKDERTIFWELSYSGMQATVTQAHIHLGQRSVNGGIVLWFCGTTLNVTGVANTPGPAGTQVCTSPSGNFSGKFTDANVQTVATQQIGPNELSEVIAAIRAGKAYANVHTLASPGGEIRGQIRGDRGHHHHDRDD
jgi:hypothetical protein